VEQLQKEKAKLRLKLWRALIGYKAKKPLRMHCANFVQLWNVDLSERGAAKRLPLNPAAALKSMALLLETPTDG
jgi:hypothetical protein